MPQCNAALDALKAADPDSALPVLIQAATFARNQQADSAIDTLEVHATALLARIRWSLCEVSGSLSFCDPPSAQFQTSR